MGGSKAGGLPNPSLSPFPPIPFPFPLSFQTNQWEGRSDPVRGKFPGSPLQIPPDKDQWQSFKPAAVCQLIVSSRDVARILVQEEHTRRRTGVSYVHPSREISSRLIELIEDDVWQRCRELSTFHAPSSSPPLHSLSALVISPWPVYDNHGILYIRRCLKTLRASLIQRCKSVHIKISNVRRT